MGCPSERRKATAKVATREMLSYLPDMRSCSNIIETHLLFTLIAVKYFTYMIGWLGGVSVYQVGARLSRVSV